MLILDLCLRKTRAEKLHDYRFVIIFEKVRFKNVFYPHYNSSNSSSVKSIFEKLRFRDGLVGTG